MYRRKGVFYCEDVESKKQESLRTTNRKEAERLLTAKNEAHHLPSLNRRIGRVYYHAANPAFTTRIWDHVFEQIIVLKTGSTKARWLTAQKDEAYRELKKTVVTATDAEVFLRALRKGGNSTNTFLRRVHNYALDMDWLPAPVIPKKQWPKIQVAPKRGTTLEEHLAIVGREFNAERKAFYEMCWHLGASQGDVAKLHGEDVDWEGRVINFERCKTRWKGQTPPQISIGKNLAALLETLPKKGPLFPYLITVRSGDRATEFKQRCKGLGIKGITLHSYRYAWAERAKKCGLPERFAMIALGHNSKAVAQAYSKKARTEIPSLEDLEAEHAEKAKAKADSRKIVPIDPVDGEDGAIAA